MLKISRILWICSIILSTLSLIWFVCGATVFFQRSLDLIATIILIGLGIPTLLLILLSLALILKRWSPTSKQKHISLWVMILVTTTLSLILIRVVHTEEWLNDRILSDPLRMTKDGKYEYRTELVNLFQKNHHERIYFQNTETGEESYLSIKLINDRIHGIGVPSDDNWAWSYIYPTDDPDQYELITTSNLPVTTKRFLINIRNSTSHLIE